MSGLPPELWVEIFRYASDIGEYLSAEGLWYADVKGIRGRYEGQAIQKSLKVKSRLARVSHAWFSLATPLLFECIILNADRPSSCRSLCDTLRNPTTAVAVKRVDIISRYIASEITSDHLQALCGLINLKVATIEIGLTAPRHNHVKQLLDTIIKALSCSSPHLEIVDYHKIPIYKRLNTLLPLAPSLRCIFSWEVLSTVPLTEFPHVRYATVTQSLFDFDKKPAGLPPMTHLTIKTVGPRIDAASAADLPAKLEGPFLHGSSITTLCLRVDLPSYWADTLVIANVCPNLVAILLVTQRWADFPPLNDIPSSIRTIGFRTLYPYAKKATYSEFFERLRGLGPTITAVRFLNDKLVNHLAYNHPTILGQLKLLLLERRWSLEDPDGVPVVFESASIQADAPVTSMMRN